MTKKQFIKVLERYQAGHASKEERDFIEAYYDLLELNARPNTPLNAELEKELLCQVWEKNRKAEQNQLSPIRKTILLPKVAAAAAAILLLVGGAVYLLNKTTAKSTHEKTRQIATSPTEPILPASTKAVLTLASGQKVLLDKTAKSVASPRSQPFVQDSGKLIYKKENSKAELLQNTLTTPRGGTFTVVLSDGTKVWLNAGSSLCYPVAFSRNKRQVRLTGEAYFEVAQDQDRPFIVAANKSKIQVLGTHFNVRAYPKGSNIKATLTEGRIRVVDDFHSQLLHPGEQAVIQKEEAKDIVVKRVNVDQVLAWKNNLFFFDHTNIKEIMAELSRWYDVEISYSTEDLKRLDFNGVMSRYGDIQAVLDRLALTGTVAFRIEGRKITVIKQKTT